MNEKADETTSTSRHEFVLIRSLDAPRKLVWKAWTEPERLKHWWGPKGFIWVGCKIDLRSGGVFHYGMRSSDGHDMWGKLVYREIVPPEKLAFVVSFTDDKGNPIRHPLSSTWPLEVLSTLLLTEQEGKTTLTMRSHPINATDEERRTFEAGFEGMQKGFTGTLDQLANYLALQSGGNQ